MTIEQQEHIDTLYKAIDALIWLQKSGRYANDHYRSAINKLQDDITEKEREIDNE